MPVSRSPYRPDDVLVDVPDASSDTVAAAATGARAAQSAWASGAAARSTALTALADAIAAADGELADLIVREVGKPMGEASGEVARTVAILRYYAQQVFDPIGAVHEPSAGGLLFSQRRPRGVAGLITPWNFPLAIPIWKAAPALAFGNAVLLKPAPEATASALRLAEICAPLLPSGLLQVLPGDAETGNAVIANSDVVSFTGSVPVGRIVAEAATRRGVPVQAEMGGQNPAIVLPDAHPERAAAQIAAAIGGFAGQKCTATKRVIVVGEQPQFLEALTAAVAALPCGDPADPQVTVGPVIDADARDRVLAAADGVLAAGGRLLHGSGTDGADAGPLVPPVLATGVPDDHPLACDEVFGPIALVQHADDAERALQMANGVDFGLAAAVYTADLAAALDLSSRLEAGLVKVNAPTTGVDFYLPFGGEKDSSIGPREQGKAAQEFYTSVHTVAVTAP